MNDTAVHLMYWGRFGGGPRLTLQTARALASKDGVSVSISYSTSSEIEADFAALAIPALAVRTFSSRWVAVRAIAELPATVCRLRRFLLSNEVRVVYLTMESPLCLLVLAVLRRVMRFKILIGIHDARPHSGDRALLHKIQRRMALGFADCLMTFSADVTEKVRSAGVAVPIFESVHGSFAVGTRERPRDLPTGRRIVLGFFGRILPYKGLDLLIAAYASLCRVGPLFSLVICGEGDFSRYEPLIRGLPNVVVDNRWIPDGDVADVVSGFDILVLPYREASQSGVIGFAAGSGVPSVATPVGGLAGQVTASACGLVSRQLTAESIAESVLRLATEAGLYSRLSAAGIAASEGVFSWSRVADDVQSACRFVLLPGGV